MKSIKFLFINLLCFSFLIGNSQQTPAAVQSESFLVRGATAHIGDGTVIENSIMVVRDGKIQVIGDANDTVITTDITKQIDATGKHIYPGFIVSNSTLGLVEIDAVRASSDQSEIGTFNPHIRSLIAYNAESKLVESMRPNGVLLGQVVPRGGRISGSSSVVQFDAWNWEDAAVKIDEGIHVNWPNTLARGRWWLGEDPGLKPNKNYAKQVKELSNYLLESKAFAKGDMAIGNLPYKALGGLFDGTKRMYVHVDDEKGISDVVEFAKAQGISKLTIVGGYEAHKVADLLKSSNVSVMLQRVHTRPSSEDDDYDQPFKLAKSLVDAGVIVSLETSGQMERMNSRNLPFYAGTTVAYGLTKEQALQLITSNPAKILGIDKDYGTLSVGKSATFFISEGDALDMRTNKVNHAFIDGRELSLETHQTELWRRYSGKYGISTD